MQHWLNICDHLWLPICDQISYLWYCSGWIFIISNLLFVIRLYIGWIFVTAHLWSDWLLFWLVYKSCSLNWPKETVFVQRKQFLY
jgi:hypothetical protein